MYHFDLPPEKYLIRVLEIVIFYRDPPPQPPACGTESGGSFSVR